MWWWGEVKFLGVNFLMVVLLVCAPVNASPVRDLFAEAEAEKNAADNKIHVDLHHENGAALKREKRVMEIYQPIFGRASSASTSNHYPHSTHKYLQHPVPIPPHPEVVVSMLQELQDYSDSKIFEAHPKIEQLKKLLSPENLLLLETPEESDSPIDENNDNNNYLPPSIKVPFSSYNPVNPPQNNVHHSYSSPTVIFEIEEEQPQNPQIYEESPPEEESYASFSLGETSPFLKETQPSTQENVPYSHSHQNPPRKVHSHYSLSETVQVERQPSQIVQTYEEDPLEEESYASFSFGDTSSFLKETQPSASKKTVPYSHSHNYNLPQNVNSYSSPSETFQVEQEPLEIVQIYEEDSPQESYPSYEQNFSFGDTLKKTQSSTPTKKVVHQSTNNYNYKPPQQVHSHYSPETVQVERKPLRIVQAYEEDTPEESYASFSFGDTSPFLKETQPLTPSTSKKTPHHSTNNYNNPPQQEVNSYSSPHKTFENVHTYSLPSDLFEIDEEPLQNVPNYEEDPPQESRPSYEQNLSYVNSLKKTQSSISGNNKVVHHSTNNYNNPAQIEVNSYSSPSKTFEDVQTFDLPSELFEIFEEPVQNVKTYEQVPVQESYTSYGQSSSYSGNTQPSSQVNLQPSSQKTVPYSQIHTQIIPPRQPTSSQNQNYQNQNYHNFLSSLRNPTAPYADVKKVNQNQNLPVTQNQNHRRHHPSIKQQNIPLTPSYATQTQNQPEKTVYNRGNPFSALENEAFPEFGVDESPNNSPFTSVDLSSPNYEDNFNTRFSRTKSYPKHYQHYENHTQNLPSELLDLSDPLENVIASITHNNTSSYSYSEPYYQDSDSQPGSQYVSSTDQIYHEPSEADESTFTYQPGPQYVPSIEEYPNSFYQEPNEADESTFTYPTFQEYGPLKPRSYSAFDNIPVDETETQDTYTAGKIYKIKPTKRSPYDPEEDIFPFEENKYEPQEVIPTQPPSSYYPEEEQADPVLELFHHAQHKPKPSDKQRQYGVKPAQSPSYFFAEEDQEVAQVEPEQELYQHAQYKPKPNDKQRQYGLKPTQPPSYFPEEADTEQELYQPVQYIVKPGENQPTQSLSYFPEEIEVDPEQELYQHAQYKHKPTDKQPHYGLKSTQSLSYFPEENPEVDPEQELYQHAQYKPKPADKQRQYRVKPKPTPPPFYFPGEDQEEADTDNEQQFYQPEQYKQQQQYGKPTQTPFYFPGEDQEEAEVDPVQELFQHAQYKPEVYPTQPPATYTLNEPYLLEPKPTQSFSYGGFNLFPLDSQEAHYSYSYTPDPLEPHEISPYNTKGYASVELNCDDESIKTDGPYGSKFLIEEDEPASSYQIQTTTTTTEKPYRFDPFGPHEVQQQVQKPKPSNQNKYETNFNPFEPEEEYDSYVPQVQKPYDPIFEESGRIYATTTDEIEAQNAYDTKFEPEDPSDPYSDDTQLNGTSESYQEVYFRPTPKPLAESYNPFQEDDDESYVPDAEVTNPDAYQTVSSILATSAPTSAPKPYPSSSSSIGSSGSSSNSKPQATYSQNVTKKVVVPLSNTLSKGTSNSNFKPLQTNTNSYPSNNNNNQFPQLDYFSNSAYLNALHQALLYQRMRQGSQQQIPTYLAPRAHSAQNPSQPQIVPQIQPLQNQPPQIQYQLQPQIILQPQGVPQIQIQPPVVHQPLPQMPLQQQPQPQILQPPPVYGYPAHPIISSDGIPIGPAPVNLPSKTIQAAPYRETVPITFVLVERPVAQRQTRSTNEIQGEKSHALVTRAVHSDNSKKFSKNYLEDLSFSEEEEEAADNFEGEDDDGKYLEDLLNDYESWGDETSEIFDSLFNGAFNNLEEKFLEYDYTGNLKPDFYSKARTFGDNPRGSKSYYSEPKVTYSSNPSAHELKGSNNSINNKGSTSHTKKTKVKSKANNVGKVGDSFKSPSNSKAKTKKVLEKRPKPRDKFMIHNPNNGLSLKDVEEMLKSWGYDLSNADIEFVNSEEYLSKSTSNTNANAKKGPKSTSPIKTTTTKRPNKYRPPSKPFVPSAPQTPTSRSRRTTTTTTLPPAVYRPHKETEFHKEEYPTSYVYMGSHQQIFPGLYSDERW